MCGYTYEIYNKNSRCFGLMIDKNVVIASLYVVFFLPR